MLSWHRQGGDKHGDAAQHKHRPHEAAHAPQKDGPTNHKKHKSQAGFSRVISLTTHRSYQTAQSLKCQQHTDIKDSQDFTCVYAAAEPAARCYTVSLHMLLPWQRPMVF